MLRRAAHRLAAPTLLARAPPLRRLPIVQPLTTLGTPEDRTKYPSPPPLYPPTPTPPHPADPAEDLELVHAASAAASSSEQQHASRQQDAVHAEEASTFLNTLHEHDPTAPCPKCLTGEQHSCPELGTHDDGPRDPAYAQAEGPAAAGLGTEERKRIVQARARDMDDEKPPCVIQEQHRLHQQLAEEEAGRGVDDAAGEEPPHEGDSFRRAGQLRVTREPGPGSVKEMVKTAGYGSRGHRESGDGYGDVFWEGGEAGARQVFVQGVMIEVEGGQAQKVRRGEA